MPIPNPLVKETRAELLDPDFREVVEKHLKTIADSSAGITEVSKELQLRYRGDFYGLLKEQGVDYSAWWYILRYNEMHSPAEWKSSAFYRVPDAGVISQLLRNWNNTYAE